MRGITVESGDRTYKFSEATDWRVEEFNFLKIIQGVSMVALFAPSIWTSVYYTDKIEGK